jgi:hypothetical protein
MFEKILSNNLSSIIDSVSNGLDSLFTSDEEKLKAKNVLENIKIEYLVKNKELEIEFEREVTKRIEAQKSIIIAEATGESYIQRNWRPLTMLTFTFIIANYYIIQPFAGAIFSIDIGAKPLEPEMWELLKIGMGGYIVALGGKKILESSKWSK